tara:strand:- start:376 stop:1023 length:648 start_codon:yes stop_codon:yes gene_type:complete
MNINFDLCKPNRKVGEFMIIDQGGGTYYHFNEFLLNKLKQYNESSIVVEVGVFGGASLLDLHTIINNPKCKLYGIDKWHTQNSMNGIFKDKWDKNDWDKYINIQKQNYDTLNEVINKYNYNITLIKLEDTGLTDNAAHHFQDNSIDFIHIDGDHSYIAVTSDLESYFPKIKKNGIMWFDDWKWPETKKAITEFSEKHNLDINVINENKCYVIVPS